MTDCLSILKNGNCRYKPDKKCLCNDQVIRGFFGNINVCAPVAEVLGIKQLYGKEADEWLKSLKS